MKVFFSWSGSKSCALANHFKTLVNHIYYDIEVYYSPDDIKAGDKWRENIEKGLDENSIGLIFLTEQNLSSKWIYFEAGALTKAMKKDKIIPLLFELNPSDVGEPLSAYQAKTYLKDDVLSVINSIGDSMEKKPNKDIIVRNFNEYWNTWKKEYDEISTAEETVEEDITDGNVLNEEQKIDTILNLLRSMNTLPREFNSFNIDTLDSPRMGSSERSRMISEFMYKSILEVRDQFGPMDNDEVFHIAANKVLDHFTNERGYSLKEIIKVLKDDFDVIV